ncbi:MAG TPA: RICIN domain-containing protein [Umezawaea sp.]|nr:RICIN domain-containing protein [Umezawaea sp.]
MLCTGLVSGTASASPDQPVTVLADQYFEIKSQLTGRCLDVRGADNGDGAPVDVYDCWGGANQKWRLADVGGGLFEIHPLNSQRCLDIAGPGGDPGAPAMQWNCWKGSKQHWRLVNPWWRAGPRRRLCCQGLRVASQGGSRWNDHKTTVTDRGDSCR